MALTQLMELTGFPSPDSSELRKRLEELQTLSLDEVMTPRSIVTALDADVQLKRVRRLRSSKAAYFPVYEGDLDHVIGWISKDKVLELLESPAEAVNIRRHLRPVGRVPMSTPVSELMEEFLKARSPFLVVMNTEGHTEGLVSLAEFVELFFGFEMVTEKAFHAEERLEETASPRSI